MHEAVKIMVPIYGAKDERFLEEVDDRVDSARAHGHKVCIVFDYHMLDPYHGVPPHLDVLGVKNQKMTSNKVRQIQGQGFAPFGQRDAWNWAREALIDMINRWDPDYIQQGEDSQIRNGWYFVAEKDHWHYNDIGGIFQQAIETTGWDGIYVVEAYKVSMVKARDRYGRDGCIWVGELEPITGVGDDTGEKPPPDDDCTAVVLENESLRSYLDRVEDDLQAALDRGDRLADQSLANMNRAVIAEQALVECQETTGQPCEDCDAKYADLMFANKDLIEILWKLILR